MTWTGWDGSEWRITDPESGVFVTGGVRGLDVPEEDEYLTESPVVDGARFRGGRVKPRECFWPLLVYSDVSSDHWIAHDAAVNRSLMPRRYGFWTVRQPSGSSRRLRCRRVADGAHTADRDPVAFGWQPYGITLRADDAPYWQGEAVIRSWVTAPPSPFFGAGVVTISSGSDLATATIDNPGDVAAWPVWTLRGPFASAIVGTAGREISVPFALRAGQSLVIDTRPERLVAIGHTGADRTDELGPANFAAVDAGAQVPLSISITGGADGASVEASLTPLYYRAW